MTGVWFEQLALNVPFKKNLTGLLIRKAEVSEAAFCYSPGHIYRDEHS